MNLENWMPHSVLCSSLASGMGQEWKLEELFHGNNSTYQEVNPSGSWFHFSSCHPLTFLLYYREMEIALLPYCSSTNHWYLVTLPSSFEILQLAVQLKTDHFESLSGLNDPDNGWNSCIPLLLTDNIHFSWIVICGYIIIFKMFTSHNPIQL